MYLKKGIKPVAVFWSTHSSLILGWSFPKKVAQSVLEKKEPQANDKLAYIDKTQHNTVYFFLWLVPGEEHWMKMYPVLKPIRVQVNYHRIALNPDLASHICTNVQWPWDRKP